MSESNAIETLNEYLTLTPTNKTIQSAMNVELHFKTIKR